MAKWLTRSVAARVSGGSIPSLRFSHMEKNKKFNLLHIAFYDISTITLIIANISVILLAIIENWTLGTLLWTYFIQSIIIGVSWFTKTIIYYKQSKKGKYAMIRDLIFPFFMMHGIYIAFILSLFNWSTFNISYIIVATSIFFTNHLFSFFYNLNKDKQKIQNAENFNHLTGPYARIIPMHITILFFVSTSFLLKSATTISLIIFLLLKTWLDATMHTKEHE